MSARELGPVDPGALSTVAQDYLKVIWSAREWSSAPVTTKMLADRLGVGASTVSETVRRLCDQGLVAHARYGSVELTDGGRALAIAMVRRHRLLETFLVSELGYAWDEVHDEAEVLEHAVSSRLMDRIDARLGYPSRDPHGDPIPTRDGEVRPPSACVLGALPGGAGTVARISDADPEILRYLASVGLVLDAHVTVIEQGALAGEVVVEVRRPGGEDPVSRRVELGTAAAAAIWLVPTLDR